MSGAEEEWVKAAMTDDTMVVELLVRLHAPLKPPTLEWSVRQRRSKPVSVINSSKQRASPTTPLSWSAATSFSGGSGGSAAAGYEHSTLNLSTTTRSKLNGDSEKTASKRSRKKKTLAELRNEENTLLKERRDLKREIAALRMHLDKQRSTNENLKRMKIEMQPIPDREITYVAEESISDQLQQKTTSNPLPPVMSRVTSDNDVSLQSSTSDGCPKFVLPDLNVPFEEGGSLSG